MLLMIGLQMAQRAPKPRSKAVNTSHIPNGMSTPLHLFMPLLQEIAELKRVTSAQMAGHSVAAQRFSGVWHALIAGHDPAVLARRELAAAALHTLLGPIDDAALADCGISASRRAEIYRTVVEQIFARFDGVVVHRLKDATQDLVDPPVLEARPLQMAPPFIALLAAQPRAGAVALDAPRLVLTPQENHAEHCWSVAVMAAGLAMCWHDGADDRVLGDVFLLGLAHHFPNAWLPDGGFAAEVVLERDLVDIFDGLNARALAMLPARLADRCRAVLAQKDTDESTLGMIFNAADVIDRVMQQRHHDAQASFRLAEATQTRGLVHEGPLQAFHNRILTEAGLI
ncbi:MAG: hypothetical protein U5O69_03795 [Candidatus Competibacteraceae bacterium]|nr:hypothetical protein [Candidatus Competibacteraceae bacterium]